MIKIHLLILIALVFIFNGCYCSWSKPKPQVVTKIEYIKEEPYKFDTIDLSGAYITLDSKGTQRMCSKSLTELNLVYKPVVDYYEWQINEYRSKDDNKTKTR